MSLSASWLAQKRNAQGFTLLEAIVTLVIVSLVITLLMQSLAHSLAVRERVMGYQASVRERRLQEQWFRESLSAAVADLPDALGGFEGDSTKVSLVTANALGQDGLARVQWYLEPADTGTSLHYSDAGVTDITVVAGPLQAATFSYLDVAGQWHSVWPPEPSSKEALPRLIRLDAQSPQGTLTWWVAVSADAAITPRLRPEDLFDGG